MRRFRYKARDLEGRELAGEVIAEDPTAAVRLIQEAGFFVITVDEARPRRTWGFLQPAFIPLEERLFLLQAWAVLLNSGFSMQSALLQLQKGTHLHSVTRTLSQVQRSVDEGMTLSEALAVSRLFPPSWIAALNVAEKTGDLISILHALREQALNYQQLKRDLLNTLIGPGVLLGVALEWMWIFIRQVIPALGMFTAELGLVNPWVEQLASSSQWILQAVKWLGVAFGVFLLAAWRSGRSDYEVGLLQAYTPTWLPVIGPLIARLNLIAVASALKLQIEAGIPIVEAVHTISRGIPHPSIRQDLFKAYRKLCNGDPIWESFRHVRSFPPQAHVFIKVGEESGKLPELLKALLDESQSALVEQIKRLAVAVRATAVLLVGFLVGLLLFCFWFLLASNYDILMKGWGPGRPGAVDQGLRDLRSS